MIIDCHGHYTTAPKELLTFRDQQLAGITDKSRKPSSLDLGISDDQIRASIDNYQLKFQKERGTDLTIFSPRAAGMAHHIGDAQVQQDWARVCNDLIARVCGLYPKNFIGAAQLPQVPGGDLGPAIAELERTVKELGFIGCNVNPDPSGGMWTGKPMTDRYWYPLYEKMVELNVPGMVHVSNSCNACFHTTGAHYINGDTTAFMQFITGGQQLFKDFPELTWIVPHGGGAVPYHWGRYRGLALDAKLGELTELLLKNVYFDTCVYHTPGLELLTKVIPTDNILFASEMVGAVKGIDPNTGNYFDDTKKYLDQLNLAEADKKKIFETNALKVFPLLGKVMKERGIG